MEIMTAKEKAIELMDKFYPYSMITDMLSNILVELTKQTAKNLSIIAVNEIISELDSERVFERIDYWNEVKEEIQKL
jgi:hypothetical protein